MAKSKTQKMKPESFNIKVELKDISKITHIIGLDELGDSFWNYKVFINGKDVAIFYDLNSKTKEEMIEEAKRRILDNIKIRKFIPKDLKRFYL
ncbi:MAG: hypothetical protein ACFFG0_20815 [Candidatus Thorarchaeota archaeon]